MEQFVRYYLAHINPMLHRSEYRGRLFPDSEIMVVMALSTVGPQSPTQICRGLGMQKGSLTSVLRRLETLGFIFRRANPSDERSYIAELTPEGADFAAFLTRQRHLGFAELFGTMTPETVDSAAGGLELIAAHLRKMEESHMTLVKDSNKRGLNWYHAASPEDRREYDAFGPWITEVQSEEDMPPRFRSAYADLGDAKYLLKVPKNADRRQLRPGMDLYTIVLAVNDGGASLLCLVESGVHRRDVTWNEVVAVGSFGDQLQGIWTLFLGDGSQAEFTYNKVSSNLMNDVTDFVRSRVLAPAGAPQAPLEGEPDIDIGDNDLFFGSSLLELRHRLGDPITPLHFEPQDTPCRDDAGKKRLSTGVLILDARGEMILVNRDRPWRRRKEAWYAANDIFIPYDRMTGYAVEAPADEASGMFFTLVLHLDRQVIRQPCLVRPESVVVRLEELGVREI